MIFPLLIVPLTTLILINNADRVFLARSNIANFYIWGVSVQSISKLTVLVSLHINLIYSLILWKIYPKFNQIGDAVYYPANSWFELNHNLGLPFIILSSVILIIALLTAWYSEQNYLLVLNLLLILEVCLVGAFSCISVFAFLLFFEVSAIPIFILMAYSGSDRRERFKASYYFLFFTLYGSISLLLFIILTISVLQINYISEIVPTIGNSYIFWILIFTAFAVKIPLFPFHTWLTYAHVEANTFTSILLAALMLKLGGYGLIKFMLPMFSIDIHLFFRPFALVICIFGVFYSSLIALRQLDIKRQIAYSSISHMSFSMIGIFSFTEAGLKGAMYLMLSHGLTSAALFFLVGVLSERYHTRSVFVYSGLLGVMPIFSFHLILASLANVGFPGTSGFIPELLILIGVFNLSPSLIFPILVGMLLTTAGTLILLLRLLFGHVKLEYSNASFSDLTFIETFILSFLGCWIIILGINDILLNISVITDYFIIYK